MSLATYASPFETETPKEGGSVIYSKNKDDKPRRGSQNRTRRSGGEKKRRDITNIIQMLHEDMSDGEDEGADTLRSTPRVAKEGVMHFEDSYDAESGEHLRHTIDDGKEHFNYSQKAMMEKEYARLRNGMREGSRAPAFLADRSRAQHQIMASPNGGGGGGASGEPSAATFGQNEMEYVSGMGGSMSGGEVSGDGDGVFYADTRNKPLANRNPSADGKSGELLDRNRSDPYEGSRRMMEEGRRHADEGSRRARDVSTYSDGGENHERYDEASGETYQRAGFQSDSECRYDLNENCGFKYPRWATRKNRRLDHNFNKEESRRRGRDAEECESELERCNEAGAASGRYQEEVERLMKKMDYMIHIMEDNEETKNGYVIEELILYCFLGFFVLFVVDSFTNVQVKYKRAVS